jgi:hypothetical protein
MDALPTLAASSLFVSMVARLQSALLFFSAPPHADCFCFPSTYLGVREQAKRCALICIHAAEHLHCVVADALFGIYAHNTTQQGKFPEYRGEKRADAFSDLFENTNAPPYGTQCNIMLAHFSLLYKSVGDNGQRIHNELFKIKEQLKS